MRPNFGPTADQPSGTLARPADRAVTGAIDNVEFHDLVFRRAAGYVDSVLKGEEPADLPVQAPTKYETIITSKPRKRSASPCRPRCCAPEQRDEVAASDESCHLIPPAGRVTGQR